MVQGNVSKGYIFYSIFAQIIYGAVFGIILGNTGIKNKRSLVHFFDGVTGFMQMLLFFILGLLSFPSQFPNIFIPALSIAIFLTFIVRPIIVFTLLLPLKCTPAQCTLISWSGLRGAASIVFAVMTVIIPDGNTLLCANDTIIANESD